MMFKNQTVTQANLKNEHKNGMLVCVDECIVCKM